VCVCVCVDVVKVMPVSLFYKNTPQDTFNLIGPYLTTLVKKSKAIPYSVER